MKCVSRYCCLLAIYALGWALASCSKSEPKAGEEREVASAPEASVPVADLPKGAMVVADITPGVRGGSLIMGNPGEIKTFNSVLVDDMTSQKVMQYFFEGIYDYDVYTQKDGPALAESWEYKPDTREWVFHFRDGLKWSDGAPLTSDDALFYTELIMDPNIPSSEGDNMKTGGKPFEFSAPDPLTFVAKIPDVDSFALLNLGMIKPLPRHKYGQAHKDGKFTEILGTNMDPKDFVCSGPHKLKEYKSGEKVVLERNPHYYKYDSRGTQLPYLDQIIVLQVENFDALALKFKAGETDVLEDLQINNLVMVEEGAAQGDYTVYNTGLRLGSTNFWFNLKPGGSYENDEGKRVGWDPANPDDEPPADIRAKKYRAYIDPIKRRWFEKVEFRRACSMAANRDAMIKTLFFGEGAPVYGMESESNKQWNNPNIPTFPYNLEKAKAELAKIGFIDRDGDGIIEDEAKNPVRFTIISNKENQIREKIAVLMKEDLGKIGMDVTVQMLDFNDILTRTNDMFDYEACLLGLGSGTPPHPSMGKNVWSSSGRQHQWNPNQKTPATPWEAEIDRLYGEMQKTFDQAEQKKNYDQMQVIWAEHQALIHLTTQKVYVAMSNRFGNVKPTVLEPHLTHNIEELYIKGK